MIDKAYIVGIDELRELCVKLDGYSITSDAKNITITRHDNGDGLNDIAFVFPVVADFWPLNALFDNSEFSPHICLHVYTGTQIRNALALNDDGEVRREMLQTGRGFGNPWTLS